MRRSIAIAIGLAAIACTVCFAEEDAKREAVATYLSAAIAGVEQIHDPKMALSILEEAGKSLKDGCRNRCQGVFDNLYESIVHGTQRRSNTERADLFRRFLHVVSRVDSQLAAAYTERFRNERPDIKLDSWATANDLFDEDYSQSLRIASLAAISDSDFPDAALTYLRKAAARSQEDVEDLNREVLTRSAVFPLNSRLELLGYVVGSQRIPQFMGDSLLDKDFVEQPPLATRLDDASTARFVEQLKLNPLTSARDDFYVLLLTEAHLKGAKPKIIASLKRAEAHDTENLTPEVVAKVSADVAKWMAAGDAVKRSAQKSVRSNQSSEEDKLHYRAIVLQALSLAHEEKLDEALDLVSDLPLRVQDNVRNALLLVVADSVTSNQKAKELMDRARSETRSDFVLAYVQAAVARVAAQPPKDSDQDPSSLLNGVEDIAGHLRGTGRLVLQLRAANIWIAVDSDRAFAALDTSLKDLNEDAGLDGAPLLTMIMGVPGMSGQYMVGQASVYQFVRRLAKQDIDSTLLHLSVSNRDDIRLRSIVAACAEYLSSDEQRDSSSVSSSKQ